MQFSKVSNLLSQAHPALSEMDRKKLCKLMDCQKLSQEACTHAAQNERLPVQVVVQVLYFEQLRMRNALASGVFADSGDPGTGHKLGSGHMSTVQSPKDMTSAIRRENRELKLELARMRMRLTDLEKDQAVMKQEILEKPLKNTKVMSSVSRKLSRFNPFSKRDAKDLSSSQGSGGKPARTPESLTRGGGFGRKRRHSIS